MSSHLPACIESTPSCAQTPEIAAPVDVVRAFLSGRSPHTLAGYSRDLEAFARFAGQASAGDAVELLLASGQATAHAAALAWKGHMIERGLSPATINRRLAAVRSLVKLARQLGRVNWDLEVTGPRSSSYRDTAGPGEDGWRKVLEQAKTEASDGSAAGVRNLALVRLLHDLGLRRGEVESLDLEHYDPSRGQLAVKGKGKLERIRLSVPGPVRTALDAWIQIRGLDPGPLFLRLDRAHRGGDRRLRADGIHELLGALGRRAGLSRRLRPHGLRHAGITAVLDKSAGNVRMAQRFSRHVNLQTLLKYDDNRTDLGGQAAGLISQE
jgi:integrase/recombinase XerC